MRLEHWLFGALTVFALACGSDSGDLVSEGGGSVTEDDDEDDDDGPTKADAGPRKDSGGSRPAPIAGNGGDDDDEPGDDDEDDETTCDSVSIQAKPNAPQILIVLDRSGSMIGAGQQEPIVNRWEPSASAVKKLTSDLNGVVDFGLMLFPAPGMAMGGGGRGGIFGGGGAAASCTPGKVDVAVKPNNAMAIAAAVDRGAPDMFAQTPTALTLEAAVEAMKSSTCADCAENPKYVLLVTDGQPTCGMGGMGGMGGQLDPAQVDATNAAIDKLKAANVGTFVIGYGTKMDMLLAQTMDSFAMHGGTGSHLAVESETELSNELRRIAGSLISCEYELNEDVDNPALVRVIIDDEEFVFGAGWTLDCKRKVVLGSEGDGICPKIKDGKVHNVRIRKACEEQVVQ